MFDIFNCIINFGIQNAIVGASGITINASQTTSIYGGILGGGSGIAAATITSGALSIVNTTVYSTADIVSSWPPLILAF